MALNFLHTCQVTKALIRIFDQQLLYEVLDTITETYFLRKLNLVIHNARFCLVLGRIVAIKRRAAHHHLIEQRSQTIKIYLKRMPNPSNDLWTHIFQATTKRKSPLFAYLCQSKISNSYMSFEINHNIFWLQIPVQYIFGMQVFDSQKYFYKIFFRLVFCKPDNFLLQMKKLPSWAIVQYHYIKWLSFEKLLHLYKKRKCDLFIDLFFVDYQVQFSVDLIFLDKFCSIKLSIPLISAKIYFAESTNTYAFEHVIGLQSTEFLILIRLEDALQVKTASQPSLSRLQLVICQPIRIYCLKVCYLAC